MTALNPTGPLGRRIIRRRRPLTIPATALGLPTGDRVVTVVGTDAIVRVTDAAMGLMGIVADLVQPVTGRVAEYTSSPQEA